MCGIGGLIKLPKCKLTNAETCGILQKLVNSLESRGNQATGIAGIDTASNAVKIYKTNESAAIIAYSAPFKKVASSASNLFLVHTRFATTGDVENNNNNHPIVGKNVILVHNGTINGYDFNETLKSENVEKYPKTEVDSQLIALLHDKYGNAKEAVSKIEGNYAYACYDKRNRVLSVVRHTNPVVVAYLEELGVLLFASEKKNIEESLLVCETRLGIFEKIVADYSQEALYRALPEAWAIDIDFSKNNKLTPYEVEPKKYAATVTHYGPTGVTRELWNGAPRNRTLNFKNGDATGSPPTAEQLEEQLDRLAEEEGEEAVLEMAEKTLLAEMIGADAAMQEYFVSLKKAEANKNQRKVEKIKEHIQHRVKRLKSDVVRMIATGGVDPYEVVVKDEEIKRHGSYRGDYCDSAQTEK